MAFKRDGSHPAHCAWGDPRTGSGWDGAAGGKGTPAPCRKTLYTRRPLSSGVTTTVSSAASPTAAGLVALSHGRRQRVALLAVAQPAWLWHPCAGSDGGFPSPGFSPGTAGLAGQELGLVALGSRDAVRPWAGWQLPPPHHWACVADTPPCAGSPGDNVTPRTQPEPGKSPKGIGLWGLRLAPVCPEPSQFVRDWETMGLAQSAPPSLGVLPVVTSYANAMQRPPVLSGCSAVEAVQGTVCEQTSGQSLAAAKESNQRSKGEQHRAAGPGQSLADGDAPCHWEPGRRAGQGRQECSPQCLHPSCPVSLLPCIPPALHPSCSALLLPCPHGGAAAAGGHRELGCDGSAVQLRSRHCFLQFNVTARCRRCLHDSPSCWDSTARQHLQTSCHGAGQCEPCTGSAGSNSRHLRCH